MTGTPTPVTPAMPEPVAAIVAKLSAARANGDPEKYIAGVTVAEAHFAAAQMQALADRLADMTSEIENLRRDNESYVAAGVEAEREGCTWFRYSIHNTGTALLIEGWQDRPSHQGEQRWSFASA